MQLLRLPAVRRPLLLLAGSALLAACSAAPTASRAPTTSAGEWLALTGSPASDAAPAFDAAPAERASAAAAEGGHGGLHAALFYIPNRIFDLLDIVRLRLRVGPGFAADIRATDAADAFVGSYASIFIGIPGPRGAPFANWPVGFENRTGAELSVMDVSSGGRSGTHYGAVEFGLGAHLGIIGLDLGVDPWEAVDFITGFVTVDPVGDDL